MIDKNKKYKTRSGHDVEIYATDFNPESPVVGAISLKSTKIMRYWTLGGKSRDGGYDSSYDLIEYDPDAELLKEAARRYPVGTEFFSAFDGEMEKSKMHPFIYNDSDKIICVRGIGDGGVVYCNGKWAEVVVVKSDWEKLVDNHMVFNVHDTFKIIIEKLKEFEG
jgi:hypothetical protein